MTTRQQLRSARLCAADIREEYVVTPLGDITRGSPDVSNA